jgi:ribokinase
MGCGRWDCIVIPKRFTQFFGTFQVEKTATERSGTVITVIGSLNMDLVTYVTRLPQIGETIIGKDFKQMPGGKGANQADAIAKLGVPVKMLGGIGADALGEALLASLHKDGVDISQIGRFTDISTGIATITVDSDGHNCIIVTPGANYRFLAEHVYNLQKAVADSQIIVTQLEIPLETVRYSLKLAKKFGKTTILNPAPACELDDALLSCVDLLIPNETELELLNGTPLHTEMEIFDAARAMVKRGVQEVIVTLGEKGCIYVNSERSRSFEAYHVNAVDTTAAGDSFIGGLAVALSEGKQIEEAISFAMAVATLTVTKKGAQSSLPYRDEVEEFLRLKL